MSLLDFPSLDATGRPYTLQEFNGRLLTGDRTEFKEMARCHVLSHYPSIERQQLAGLQHSLSKEDLKAQFAFRETDPWGATVDAWRKGGAGAVLEAVAEQGEHAGVVGRIGRGILRLRNGVGSVASKMLPASSQEQIDDRMRKYAPTMNWQSNWVRCVAWAAGGTRLAVAQPSDYIRVYTVEPGREGSARPAPLTLKHPRQRNVGVMAWDPCDPRVLAVGAGDVVIVWRLTGKAKNLKPSAECAQVIPLGVGPITSLHWDPTSAGGIVVASCNSNKIFLVATSTTGSACETESVAAWTGGSVTGLAISPDGQRVAVMYTASVLRVYSRSDWREEKWFLSSRVTSAVWSPDGAVLLFSTADTAAVQAIHFASRVEQDGSVSWSGGVKPCAVFDCSPVEWDPSLVADNDDGVVLCERPSVTMGGAIRHLSLSPDGLRLAVAFHDNSSVVALFMVDWKPTVKLLPCGLIEAPLFGAATIVGFQSRFDAGAMMYIVWSGGEVQYIPLIYGGHCDAVSMGRHSLVEQLGLGRSRRSGMTATASLEEREEVGDSLRSADFPSGIVDATHRSERPTSDLTNNDILSRVQ